MRLLAEPWIEWSSPAAGGAARQARDLITAQFTRHGASQEVIDVARLLTTELIANVVMHVGGHLRLRVGRTGGLAYIAVEDEAPDRLPVLRAPSFDWEEGRGILLADVLAAAWGCEVGERTKTVWCALPLDGRPA